jgi:hypothetical protein
MKTMPLLYHSYRHATANNILSQNRYGIRRDNQIKNIFTPLQGPLGALSSISIARTVK